MSTGTGLQHRCKCKAMAKDLSRAVLAPDMVFVAHPTISRAMTLVKARGKARAKAATKAARKFKGKP